MIRSTEDTLRKALGRLLGHQPRADIWDTLVLTTHFVDAVEDVEAEIEVETVAAELISLYQELVERHSPAKPRRETVETPGDSREEALVSITAMEASGDEQVAAFRREVLRGRLVKPENVSKWIAKQLREAGPPTWFLSVPVKFVGRKGEQAHPRIPMGARVVPLVKLDRPISKIHEDMQPYGGTEARKLDLVWNDEDFRRDLSVRPFGEPVRAGSVLDRLRLVGQAVERRYGWDKGYGATFVLTDEPPPARLAYARIKPVMTFPAASRIVLTLSPRLKPRDVVSIYSQAREHFVGPGRDRAPKQKTADLAVFAAKHKDDAWEQVMRKWNQDRSRSHPEEKRYENRRNFIRDARKAYKQVTGKWPEWRRPS